MKLETIPEKEWPTWIKKLVAPLAAAVELKPSIPCFTFEPATVTRVERYMRRTLKPRLRAEITESVKRERTYLKGKEQRTYLKGKEQRTEIRNQLATRLDGVRWTEVLGRSVRLQSAPEFRPPEQVGAELCIN